ncbi:MAG: TOBE domain-containing protein, partial [Solirubrobacteraceae bacterium]
SERMAGARRGRGRADGLRRGSDADALTVYSGQHEQTMAALTADFTKRTGIAELARFLGDANILPARLAGDTADTRLGRLRLRSPLAGGAPRDGVVVLRPEELQIVPAKGAGPANALVTAVEYFGHDARIALMCDHPAGEFALLARTREIEAPHVGQRVVCRATASAHAL